MTERHYFDWAATAAPVSSLGETYPYGNPSSMHREGRQAREALESARARCAAVLCVSPDTLYFTSGGTEANCIPLFSLLARHGSGRLIASAGEHTSITENLRVLERLGKLTGQIPINSNASVTRESLAKTLDKYEDVRMCAIMAVNNEIGTVNEIQTLRSILYGRDGQTIHMHCDMVQAAGKIPLDLAGWGVDSASLSAHKLGGPRGIGLLYLRKPLTVLYTGGGQERNIRPGTENVVGALALASCLELHAIPEKLKIEYTQARERWAYFINGLKKINRCRIIPGDRSAADENFSPYIVQAAFSNIPGEVMVRALDDRGFAVSTGSACSSASPERPVLAAMGMDNNARLEGIRISQGWSTTIEEIDLLLAAITEAVKLL